jgi:hypothetical protein
MRRVEFLLCFGKGVFSPDDKRDVGNLLKALFMRFKVFSEEAGISTASFVGFGTCNIMFLR